MSVTLRQVREDELPEVVEATFRFYATDLVRHAGLTPEEAEEKARADHAALLPEGRPLDGHYFFVIEDGQGDPIGHLWYADRDDDAFLYAIELREEVRGRGKGREAMRAFEELVRERGRAAIWLNVFGANDIARSLYRSLDYREASVHMSKRLS
jgi:ribosomal protein S18 acetylase RimI-like enzyme